MEIVYRHSYSFLRRRVWEALHDEDVLRRRLPGCKRFTRVDDGSYQVELGLDIGPVRGRYNGRVTLLDAVEPERYRLLLSGSSGPGSVEADALIHLQGNGEETELTCQAQVQVTGTLAAVGQRVIGTVARLMLGQFFSGIEAELASTSATEAGDVREA